MVVATPALVPSGWQQWIWAAVSFDVNPKNDARICNVFAVGSSTTDTVPEPAGLTGGTSLAPDRTVPKVIVSAWATGRGAVTRNENRVTTNGGEKSFMV